MKLLPVSLAPLIATTAASLVLCSAGFASTPPSTDLTIENHHKLVTVKDGNGSWLFAQVIATSNVTITTVASGQNSSRVALQDETGKTLWSKPFNNSFPDITLHGEWQDKAAANCPQIPDDLGLKPSKSSSRFDPSQFRFEIVIGAEDQLVTAHIILTKHRVDVTPINHGLVFKADNNQTLIILQPPAAPAVAQASTH